jgi:hypothetical protein
MNASRQRPLVSATLVALLSCLAMTVSAGGRDDARGQHGKEPPLTVPKAKCGPHDKPETGLQGQVPAALRAAGFKGFNCNLELIGQSRGDGGNWQTTQFREELRGRHHRHKGHHHDRDKRERVCGYHGTASPTLSSPGRTNFGVPVLDVTDLRAPTQTAQLTTTSMLDPWESLKVNERRQLLAADNGQNGGGGPEIDIYDISDDCRFPQLLASVAVGTGTDGGVVAPVIGHEGSFAPDGLTYYGGDLRNAQYYAVDTTNPREPKMLAAWKPGVANVHGMSISDDGKRGYFVSLGVTPPADLTNPAVAPVNGLLIYDLTEIQKRKPNPQVKLVSQLLWKDGSAAQHTINVKIRGKPYVIFVDEGGSGGGTSAAQLDGACAAGLPVFPMARIIDISNESKPKIVSRIMTEVHDPATCSKVRPDLVGLSIFTYGTHYCSVDNRHNATTLACGMFNSGIRVYDIRDPVRVKEIAYYNPAGTTTVSKGSNHTLLNNWVPGGPDWCSAQVHLDAKKGTLWTTCQDNGVLTLKFRHGVWPFPESSTPDGEQN